MTDSPKKSEKRCSYKSFWQMLRAKNFYLPMGVVLVVVLLWIGIDLWRRWKITALLIGILVEVLGGCRDVRLFKAS